MHCCERVLLTRHRVILVVVQEPVKVEKVKTDPVKVEYVKVWGLAGVPVHLI
jgi:hypothetical protein